MTSYLYDLAVHIQSQHTSDASGSLVCLPTRRAVQYFQAEAIKLFGKKECCPKVITFTDWVYALSSYKPIEPVALTQLLYQAYRLAGGTDSFEDFLSAAATMLADFDEIDMQLADASKIYEHLYQLKSLNTFLDDETTLSPYSANYRHFWSLFKGCYQHLQELLLPQNLAYEGMLYREAAGKIATVTLPYDKVYFAGFSGLSKSEEHIIRYLIKQGKAEFCTDTDTYYLSNLDQEAGQSFRHYQKTWGVKGFFGEGNWLATLSKKIQVIGVAGTHGQALLTADILAHHIPHAGADTVIVLPEQQVLSPLLAQLPDSIGHVNVTMGMPLADTQPAQWVRRLHDLHENTSLSQSGTLRFYHRDVIALLEHPYMDWMLADKTQAQALITYIRSHNKISITLAELHRFMPTGHPAADVLFSPITTAIEYLQQLSRLLQLLHTAMTADTQTSHDTDLESLVYLQKASKQLLTALPEHQTDWTIEALRMLITQEIKQARLAYEGQTREGLQIMGMMETRCLDFKHVVILSLNEDIYPTGKKHATFLPFEIRHNTLTTHRDREANAAYLYYRLLQRAENIYLVYNTQGDTLGGGEKSRYILQTQLELAKLPNIQLAESNFVTQAPPSTTPAAITITKSPELTQRIADYLADKGLSPTALNSYINCELQFYLRYIASWKQVDDIEESMEAGTMGSSVHKALEVVYEVYIGKPLIAEDIAAHLKDTSIIERTIKDYLRKRFDEESIHTGKNYLLYQVCLKLATNFLKNELIRIQANSSLHTSIVSLEQELSQTLTIAGYPVLLKGFTDRVERVAGVVQIADYKTGDTRKGKLDVTDMSTLFADPEYAKAFQLLMYAWLYARSERVTDGIRSGIYWLRDPESRYEGLSYQSSEVLTTDVLVTFRAGLEQMLTQLLSSEGTFAQTTDIERCKYCEFARICGRD
jgi:ATP-dependent helicase/nuclease subunit B